ncbi:MAG: MFS transporter [Burkholderiaceae bacterium]|nr:MFS transporter [Rhodoferax sp.]MCP5286783.1 MFS transporter [Burkholderiaceae bacterium]
MFLGFAVAYFLSALLRAVTATLAPAFSADLGLAAAELGLLAGAYFFGFAAMQLPLGSAIDRFGPRRVQFTLMLLAVLGCGLFALARGLPALLAARVLIGAGVAACLMSPLTAFRHRFSPAAQLRANSWMLMTGSLGMLASTLPVQWLLPSLGWRGLFWAVAAALAVSMAVMMRLVPRDAAPASLAMPAPAPTVPPAGYREILRHPLFLRLAPLALFQYGGLIAVQALWAGPWLTQVGGRTPAEAAAGLFVVNGAMLFTFLAWGLVMPRLVARGITALQVLRWGMPLPLLLLAHNVWAGADAGPWAWAAWCVSCTCMSISQPALAQVFPPAQAGRALSAYNLVIFGGVFTMQWGIGLAIDALRGAGWAEAEAFRTAFGGFGVGCAAAYAWFLWRRA